MGWMVIVGKQTWEWDDKKPEESSTPYFNSIFEFKEKSNFEFWKNLKSGWNLNISRAWRKVHIEMQYYSIENYQRAVTSSLCTTQNGKRSWRRGGCLYSTAGWPGHVRSELEWVDCPSNETQHSALWTYPTYPQYWRQTSFSIVPFNFKFIHPFISLCSTKMSKQNALLAHIIIRVWRQPSWRS